MDLTSPVGQDFPTLYIHGVTADWGHPSPNRNKTIYLYLCSISSYPKFYINPNWCSSFILAVIEGVLDGLPDSKATQGAPTLTGSFLGKHSLTFTVRSVKIDQTGSFNRSDRSTAASTCLQPARSSAYGVWPNLRSTGCTLHLACPRIEVSWCLVVKMAMAPARC
jgi:hypothetical protein